VGIAGEAAASIYLAGKLQLLSLASASLCVGANKVPRYTGNVALSSADHALFNRCFPVPIISLKSRFASAT